jgi:serine/threonine-protein kinase
MGSVFRGRDLRSKGLVAVKILAPEHCRKPKVLARFEREAETMTTLRHPNIVQLHGHGRRGALPYIVMELLDGLTLSDVLLKREGRLSLAEAIGVVKQVASGLSFLHHHGLVHRDVKPQNIVIGAGGRVTILDLGVVRDQANPGLTRPGAMVGTPYYMSPEQIYGVDDIDRRTDVYALAAMTFELLTGRPPFLGNNNFEVLYGHKNVAPPDASLLVKSVTRPVAQVLMRGMAKKRDERPDSVSELVADLEAAAGVKKIDLGKAFAFVTARPPEKTSLSPRIAGEPTRMVPRHVPRSDAEPEEGSSPEPEPDEAERTDGKTVMLRVDATFIGPAPGREEEKTRYITMPDLRPVPEGDTGEGSEPLEAGELQVLVSFRGRAVRAAVTVDRTMRAHSPCTLSLSPGDHAIRVELAGYQVVERSADISPAQQTTIRVALEKI